MKNLVLLTVLVIFHTLIAQAQNQKMVTYEGNKSLIKTDDYFLTFNDKALIDQHTKMVQTASYADKRGHHHTRYQQYYQGLKVRGGNYMLHSNKDHVYRSNGNILRTHGVSIIPEISLADAELKGKAYFESLVRRSDHAVQFLEIQVESAELCLMDLKYPDISGNTVLAYEILITGTDRSNIFKKLVYIQAKDGSFINAIDKIKQKTIPAKGKSNFYGQVDFTQDSVAENRFLLQDLTKGNGIYVLNYNTGKVVENDTSYWDFQDLWENSAIDAMFGATKFYDFLKDRYNYNSIDNNGFALISNVREAGLVNAYWDGTSSTFGTGDCFNYNPFTSIEIVAHEFTHGLTEFSSNLVYRDEPGALNEAMSDIFGKALEYYTVPQHFSWTIGQEIPKKPTVDPIRSMSDPNIYECPKYYKGKYWSTNFIDNGGVHSNSGVLNYWFYLLVNGKSGTNEKNVPFDVKAIGMDNAIDLAFNLNVNYLNENSNYFDAYTMSLAAANDLFNDSLITNSILEAWKAVGITEETILVGPPDEPIYAFEITLNNYNGNDLKALCQSELSSLSTKIINRSKNSIPAGSEIHFDAFVSYYSNDEKFVRVDFLDTIQILPLDLNVGDSLTINYSGNALDLKLVKTDNINLVNILSIHRQDSLVFNKFYTIEYSPVVPMDKENTISMETIYLLPGQNCIGNPLLNFYGFVENNYCEATDIEYFVKISGTKNSIILPVDHWTFYSITDIRLQLEIDTNYLGTLDDLLFEVFFKTDNELLLFYSTPVDMLLYLPLKKDEVLTFEEPEIPALLRYNSCLFCNFELSNGMLEISNNISPSELQTCMNIEDYLDIIPDHYVSNVTFCVDLEDIKEPELSFDLKMNGYNDYEHVLKVEQDGNPIGQVISNTGSNIKQYTFPLSEADISQIALTMVVFKSSIFLDNIKIESNVVGTEDAFKPVFMVKNPVSDEISITNQNTNEKWDVELINLDGQKMAYQSGVTGEMRIDCSSFPSGIYFYRIVLNGQMFRGKIMVVR